MNQLEELLEMWRKDADMDRTEPGRELLNIPKLHSKYVTIMSNHRMMARDAEFQLNRWKKLKWEYYTGKLDDDDLKKFGWDPFPFTLKSDITTYLEADEDINKYKAKKVIHDEIVDVCTAIIKELNSRTFQLRDFIAWERFVNGA
jgi:hypothetical protein